MDISEETIDPRARLYSAAEAVTRTVVDNLKPRLNGAKIFGVRTGRPIVFSIAASGERPMRFEVEGLPSGVTLDRETGQFRGAVATPGSYSTRIRVSNRHGTAAGRLTLQVGERHTLTPPMGWNSWNCWGGAVSEEKVLQAAQALVTLGLDQHGWSYVNIDDGWQGTRLGGGGAIQPNKKFRDMPGLAKRVHELGLKFGIYSTPWRGTYEGHIGSYADEADGSYDWVKAGDCNEFFRIGRNGTEDWDRKRRTNWQHGHISFVRQDVAQWIAWGVDYLKYDWKPNDVDHTREIAEHLQAADRDVVLSLSNKAPFWDAAHWSRYANCWRTTADIQDTWASVAEIGFNQDRWSSFAGPGHWNDPDMLQIGNGGMTDAEERSHFSLWAMMAAPLFAGNDITAMDARVREILLNQEVIAIDQDRLGIQGHRVRQEENREVWSKPLADGSRALVLFNRGPQPVEIAANWTELGYPMKLSAQVRNVWTHKPLGRKAGAFSATVPAHGVVMVRITPEAGRSP